MQVVLPRHVQSVVMAKVPVQHQVGERDHPSDSLPQGAEHPGNAQ